MHDGTTGVRRRLLDVTAKKFVDEYAPSSLTLPAADDARSLAGKLDGVAIVELYFGKSGDGRAYTQARILRDELGYRGKIRATGAVVVDCIGFMRRCGIDEIVLRDESDEQFAVAALERFSVLYQAAADVREPLSRRVKR